LEIKNMKVIIWVHKDDVIIGEIREHHFQCPQIGYKNYVQVEITQDEFVQLRDRKHAGDDLEFNQSDESLIARHKTKLSSEMDTPVPPCNDSVDSFVVKQYNRNREFKDQITDESQIKK